MLSKPEGLHFPSIAEWRAMWAKMDAHLDPTPSPAADAMIDRIRQEYRNGDAFRATFLLDRHSVFDFLVAAGNYKFLEFPQRFFQLSGVRAALPKLKLDTAITQPALYESVDAFSLDGELARWLSFGGAYSTAGYMRPSEAKRMAMAACSEWFGERYDEVDAFCSGDAWTSFFHGIAWDSTWVVLDKRTRRVQFLCGTDAD
jgi:hypothetical protein